MEQIEITQPENTVRYWCPIDVPVSLNTEENEIAYAKRYCKWTPESEETPKQAICRQLRGYMTECYRSMFIEQAQKQAQSQAQAQIDQIL